MAECIDIKCPFCSATLRIKNTPGIETKNIKCPNCNKSNAFTEFKPVAPKKTVSKPVASHSQTDDDPGTDYVGKGGHGKSGEDTVVPVLNQTPGMLRDLGNGQSYQLKPGLNIVGRKANSSKADIQIDTGDKNFMSRQHIVIDVKKIPKGYVHHLKLYQEKVNETLVNNQKLTYGDCIVLNHGYTIKLPDAVLVFELPDEERTIL